MPWFSHDHKFHSQSSQSRESMYSTLLAPPCWFWWLQIPPCRQCPRQFLKAYSLTAGHLQQCSDSRGRASPDLSDTPTHHHHHSQRDFRTSHRKRQAVLSCWSVAQMWDQPAWKSGSLTPPPLLVMTTHTHTHKHTHTRSRSNTQPFPTGTQLRGRGDDGSRPPRIMRQTDNLLMNN